MEDMLQFKQNGQQQNMFKKYGDDTTVRFELKVPGNDRLLY